MTAIKFTNVKFYTGGGKVPRRLRTNQNHTEYFHNDSKWLKATDAQLIRMLYYWTEGRIHTSKETKVCRKTICYT